MTEKSVRIDQWLWAARFFKTRALANTAIKNGRILINQQRCKPARDVQIHDTIFIQKTADLSFEVTVKSLEHKRASAKLVIHLYAETADSIEKRRIAKEQQTLANNMVHFPEQRPDKRERRTLRNIRHFSP